MVDTAFSYLKSIDRLLILQGIFQSKRKYFACNLKCRHCVFTWYGRSDDIDDAFLLEFICSLIDVNWSTVFFSEYLEQDK